MEGEKILPSKKGGRPKSPVKKSEQLAVMCNLVERKYIEAQAGKLNISVSQYLREAGMKGQIVRKIKTLPREVLQLIAQLGHVGNNLNQIARKRNLNEELNALERAELNALYQRIKEIILEIKNAFL